MFILLATVGQLCAMGGCLLLNLLASECVSVVEKAVRENWIFK